MYKYVLFILFSLFLSVIAEARIEPWQIAYVDRPRAQPNVTGLFFDEELPSLRDYFYREQLSRYEWNDNSYVLIRYPVQWRWWIQDNPIQGDLPEWGYIRQEGGWLDVSNTDQWYWSGFNNAIGVVYLDTRDIYTSFSEYSDVVPPGQCVAFAKIATQDRRGTNQWYAGKNVIERVRDVFYAHAGVWWPEWRYHYDPSYEHRGRMVAFFGWGAAGGNQTIGYDSQYSQSASVPGHVGIFLKYAYDDWGYPIGFWIADENYEGTATWNNPDGKIRKHLILINSGGSLGHTYADQYFFVDIPVKY